MRLWQVLYEMCCLRRPFDADSLPRLTLTIVQQPPPPLKVPNAEMATLATALLQKRPIDRLSLDGLLCSKSLQSVKECCNTRRLRRSLVQDTRLYVMLGASTLNRSQSALNALLELRRSQAVMSTTHAITAINRMQTLRQRRRAYSFGSRRISPEKLSKVSSTAPSHAGTGPSRDCEGGEASSSTASSEACVGPGWMSGRVGELKEVSTRLSTAGGACFNHLQGGLVSGIGALQNGLTTGISGVQELSSSLRNKGGTVIGAVLQPLQLPLGPLIPLVPMRHEDVVLKPGAFECSDGRRRRGQLWLSGAHLCFLAIGGEQVSIHLQRVAAVEIPPRRICWLAKRKAGSLRIVVSGTPETGPRRETFHGFSDRQAAMQAIMAWAQQGQGGSQD